ncbi:MAG: carbamoyltransferase HypF, partial [Anaerolineae bacterium]|nr:carbamoyltransferase HypF [Anaerolineae bacterium]
MSKTGSYRIAITGVVQGVGFRPFVYNLATGLDLSGWVLNHSGGVDIEVAGQEETLAVFIQKLREEAPPLSYIESLAATPITPQDYKEFEIRHSEHKAGQYQLISPDVATCQDCIRELFDPQDRRYHYPFTNCTNCGPRFTIIADIPYDRPNTTMHKFPLCPECNTEYQDPRDRRFHAQPNACHICGPHLWLTTADGGPLAASETRADNEAVLAQAKELLLDGKILAIKGLGGFHLACDATNAEAVQRLRARKHRPNKPFAVMVPTLDVIRDHCEVPAVAEELIKSPQCPIVLLDKRPASTVAGNVAPNSHTLGMMIPYTPLHHLLLNDVKRP